MQPTHANGARRPAGLPWPFLPAFLPFWYGWLAWCWWGENRAQLAAVGAAEAATGLDPAAMAWVALLARLMAALSEAAVYALWWRSRGARLPYWRFFSWVVGLSTADLLGFSLRRAAGEAPEPLRIACAVLAGPAALEAGGPDTGSAAVFGSFGILALLRVGLTGWAQVLGTGRPPGGPLAFTAGAWLLTRLVGWWSFDLLKGLSPVR